MKTTTFTLLLLLSCCRWLAAQCPTDITFSSQGQIDSFPINYPGCTDIPGSVRISGSDVTNLQGLSTLDSINGCLCIEDNPVLGSLNGLENLSYVGKSITGGHTVGLEISNNEILTSLAGLDHLKSVRDRITVIGNPLMTALNGLDSLSVVGTGIGGLGTSDPYRTYSIRIWGNKSLKSISGLANLDSLDILEISYNDSLLSLIGLEHLQSIGWGLKVSGNYSLKNFIGLDSLQLIGSIHVEDNYFMENFHGLQNLKTIKGCIGFGEWGLPTFLVANNFSLIDFSGLGNLQNIESIVCGEMSITGNWSLQSLMGFGGNIDSLENLTIQDNPNLSTCDIQPVCNYLENGGIATISNNAPGCNSVPEVEAACIASGVFDRSKVGHLLATFPNPATDFLSFQLPETTAAQLDVQVFDAQGRLVLLANSQQLDVQALVVGMYLLKVVVGERVFVGKFVKQ